MKKTYLLAAVAAATLTSAANAATLISAAVFGTTIAGLDTGTVWTTANAPGTNTSNYTLFLQNPGLGNFLNPNDEAISYTTQAGNNYAFLAGDGYPIGGNANSDLRYRLELTFDNGAVLQGAYAPGSINTFIPGSAVTVGNETFTLNEFSFTRSLANVVGQFQATPGTGDGNDYQGNYRFTSSVAAGAVPEPASWALMLGGFGLAGAAFRRRRQTSRVVFA